MNSKGIVVERCLALVHVKETTTDALKEALLAVLYKNKLSVSRIRGQGYDRPSNMRSEFNGLKEKILDENPYAFFVHCFAISYSWLLFLLRIVALLSLISLSIYL